MSKTYVANSPGKRCRICGKDISERRTADICLECKKAEDKERMKQRRAYATMLIARDTFDSRIIKRATSKKTSEEKAYAVCPVCGGVLNIQDVFCRYCGKRLMTKEEEELWHKK